jgi:hypothetical protein
MDAALLATVRDIEASAVYQGTRYTQDVWLSADGTEFRVYDPGTVVTPDALGTERTVELAVIMASVDHHPEATTGIGGDRGVSPSFRGIVVSYDDDGEAAILDVGAGTVRIDTTGFDAAIHVGEFFELTDVTVHVEDIDPEGGGYEAFVEQLSAEDADTRQGAAAYLGTRGSERAVDALVSQFRAESDPAVRETIVGALGRIAIAANAASDTPDASIRSTLEAAVGDEAERVRDRADEWLDRVEDHWRN